MPQRFFVIPERSENHGILFPFRRIVWLCSLLILILNAGCGSDKSGDPIRHGEFTAFTITGLEYSCYQSGRLTRQGATNDDGRFYYRVYEGDEGTEVQEDIQFMIGGIEIGKRLTPTYKMSPLDFDTDELMSDETINIASFLQTLDEERPVTRKSELDLSDFNCPDNDDFDCNCSDDDCDVSNFPNGIKITKPVRDAIARKKAEGFTINFKQSTDAFQKDETVLAIINYLNEQGVFNESEPRTLVSTEQATRNLKEALALNNALPVIIINLGDDFTCGTQSGKGNVHEYTQKNSFPKQLANYAAYASDFLSWYQPNIDLKAFYSRGEYNRQHMTLLQEDLDTYKNDNMMLKDIPRSDNVDELIDNDDKYIDYIYVPTNLGADGATTETLISEKTGQGDSLLDALMEPIPEEKNEVVSQLEAAEYVGTMHPDKQKIFTLWIGLNDVLGAITENGGTEMTTDAITAFLSDTGSKHDLTSVTANIKTIVDRLTAIPDSHVFIGNLPHVTSFAVLFNETDLEHLATFATSEVPADVTTLNSGQYIGLFPFINRTSTEEPADSGRYTHLIADLEVSIASALGKYYSYTDDTVYTLNDNTTLNTAISQTVAASDGYTLSNEEARLLNDHIDAINLYIEALAAENANVTVVDLKKTIFDKLDVDYNKILDADGDLREDKETKQFVLGNYVYITTKGDPEDEEDPDLNDWEYRVLSRTFGGGFYSLDGVHPSNTGYLVIANEFIKSINEAMLGIDISETTATFFYSTYKADPYQDDDKDGFAPGPGSVSDRSDYYSDESSLSCLIIDSFYSGLADCSDSKKKTYPPYISGKDLCSD
ncbi:MAG: SGNH/GDSL hydrolase family protein [Proteobacteria bacterium]|nr:SGNH/GDSL hydrolase family protein [Pseudomonadota bacterium]